MQGPLSCFLSVELCICEIEAHGGSRFEYDVYHRHDLSTAVRRLPFTETDQQAELKDIHFFAMTTIAEHILLCRPHGGLNDTLCQIERCWRYAQNHHRRLVLDTRRSCLFGEFRDFFGIIQSGDRVASSSQDLSASHLATSCYPPQLHGRLDTYKAVYSRESHNYIDSDSKVPLTFDFERAYEEPIIVHEQCGGGTLSLDVLRRVTLNPQLASLVTARLEALGKGYVAIHVRNTDYRTDFFRLFEAIRPSVSGKRLLICSDDHKVIIEAMNFFKEAEVLTSSNIPDTGQAPLHSEYTKLDDDSRRQSVVDSIVDLLALARAEELYFSNVTKGHPSGFSALAKLLQQDRRTCDSLLGVS